MSSLPARRDRWWWLAPLDSERRSLRPVPAEREDRVDLLRVTPFLIMHLGCLLVFWVGWSATAIAVCAALYAVRMFAITAVYHRLLSHRTFRTSRALQLVGAVAATASAQRGPLWWAAHHRRHHRHTEEMADAHSPVRHGFWWSHLGWFMTPRNFRTDHDRVRDLMRFPELRWLDRFDAVVPLLLCLILFLAGELLAAFAPHLGTDGLQLLVWGFCISTTLLFHATSAVNSLAHRIGSRRYATRDDSRNSFWLALLTFGEGWHNNHHFHASSVRQGFRWWEVDLTWYLLRAMAAVGLVWDLRPVPARAHRQPAAAGGRR